MEVLTDPIMRIGPYTLSSPFLLAPMAGITDAPFRKLCRRFGAGLTPSEMTTADIGLWRTAKSRHRLDLDMDAEPRVIQIAGSEPEQMALAAKLCEDRGAQIVDINMGCPAKKVCRKARRIGAATGRESSSREILAVGRGRGRCAGNVENPYRLGFGASS